MLSNTSRIYSKKHLCLSQDCDTRLTELAARVCDLQKTGESSITQETFPTGVILTVDAVAKDLDRYFILFIVSKQNVYSQDAWTQLKGTMCSVLKQIGHHHMLRHWCSYSRQIRAG